MNLQDPSNLAQILSNMPNQSSTEMPTMTPMSPLIGGGMSQGMNQAMPPDQMQLLQALQSDPSQGQNASLGNSSGTSLGYNFLGQQAPMSQGMLG